MQTFSHLVLCAEYKLLTTAANPLITNNYITVDLGIKRKQSVSTIFQPSWLRGKLGQYAKSDDICKQAVVAWIVEEVMMDYDEDM